MSDSKPKRWWQWVLQYPAVIVALVPLLVGALPQYLLWIQSYLMGVPVSQVGDASEQAELWQGNADCIRRAQPMNLRTPDRFLVRITACQATGDVLIEVQSIDDAKRSSFRWVRRTEFKDHSFDGVIMPAAYHLQIQEDPQRVCAKVLKDGRVRYVIRDGNTCRLQVYNPITRIVEVSVRINCQQACEDATT